MTTWLQTLLIALPLAVGALLLAGLWSRREQRLLRLSLTELKHRLEATEDQLSAMRRELAGLQERIPGDAMPEDAPVDSAYSQAMRLAQQGLDSGAVAAGCGISRGEAELIVALYRASQRP